MSHRLTFASALLLPLCAAIALAAVPQESRALMDRVVASKGTYVPEEGVYKIIVPREEATIILDYERLSPHLGLNSWAAFASAIHHPAILSGQFLLLEDEVDSVVKVVLENGLEVTGLAASSLFDGPRLHTLDVTGLGSFQGLATAFRRGLDEIKRVRAEQTRSRVRFTLPDVPKTNSIDADPLNAVLSMRGTAVGGVYRAAIGRRVVVNGEMVGREMGMSTWLSISGTNQRAVVQSEFIVNADEIKKVLLALRLKGLHLASIRNHTVGEHPQSIFIRFWGQGTALELAKSVRYALDVEVGAIPLPGGARI